MVLCLFWSQNFDDISPYVGSYYFSSIWVAEWPSLRKEPLTRLTMYSLCILTVCGFSYFLFWF